MPYYDYEDVLSDELGDTKKAVKKVTLVKKVPATKPVVNFGTNMRQQRQSTNVIDLRQDVSGTIVMNLKGYLTWNTYFHLSYYVGDNIISAAQAGDFR